MVARHRVDVITRIELPLGSTCCRVKRPYVFATCNPERAVHRRSDDRVDLIRKHGVVLDRQGSLRLNGQGRRGDLVTFTLCPTPTAIHTHPPVTVSPPTKPDIDGPFVIRPEFWS